MPYDLICQNPLCNKPFRTYSSKVKCCSRACGTFGRTPMVVETRFWAKVDRCAHGDYCPFCCWTWSAGRNRAGYGLFGIKEDKEWISRLAHTIAWKFVNKRPIHDGLQINHHCDNPPCCNPWHIYLGTQSQNAFDAYQRGQQLPGEARSHLKTADVVAIRRLYRDGLPLLELAQQFHVGQSTIFHILSGRSWHHIPGDLSAEERYVLVLRRRQMVSRTRPRTILTPEKVKEIRILAQKDIKQSVLASQFGVNVSTIKAIIHRRIWKDVE